MIITIPTIQKEIVGTEIVKTRGEMKVSIDTSFLAHLKWEEQFQKTLGCDLTTYTERVRNWTTSQETAKANFVGLLKLLYCYVNSEKIPTFKEFCSLFDYEVADEILTRISVVLEEVGNTVSKN